MDGLWWFSMVFHLSPFSIERKRTSRAFHSTSVLLHIWRFPKSWGYAQSSSIYIGFSMINHAAIGLPPFKETTISRIHIHIIDFLQKILHF